MTIVKTPDEVRVMEEGGRRLGIILQSLLHASAPGTTLRFIEDLAIDLIAKSGGTPSFQTVKGYRWATCLCVNDVVVHGIPTESRLKTGDVLTIDVGFLFEGFHTDTAWTKLVNSQQSTVNSKDQEEKERFLKVGEEALWDAIDVARVGNRIGHISQVFQTAIEGAGYSVVRTLVGHGVGRELHEAPQVPGYLKGAIEDTLLLEEGMTLALEIIYAKGSGAVEYVNNDGWTIATKDGSLASVFEHTIVLQSSGPVVLTRWAQ